MRPHRSRDGDQPSLIHLNATLLFRLDRCPQPYAHLLKKKDLTHISPLVEYLIGSSGHVVCLGGDAVRNRHRRGKRKYKRINLLAIMNAEEAERYASVMNNIISSNDGAFSLGWKYRVRKNRGDGFFKDVACARYVIEPRLEGIEKLLYLFRPSSIELDIATEQECPSVLEGMVR